jgi:predicted regulator of Ras-like GTPase activity (Roadblock/LC7/MglB family)
VSFIPALEKILHGSGGALAAILMGRDGLAIQQALARRVGEEEAERLGNAGVELGRILEEIRKASDAFLGGAAQEVIVGLEHYWLVLRCVDEDTVLVVALAPEGNVGKARFLMRRYVPVLQADL